VFYGLRYLKPYYMMDGNIISYALSIRVFNLNIKHYLAKSLPLLFAAFLLLKKSFFLNFHPLKSRIFIGFLTLGSVHDNAVLICRYDLNAYISRIA
jgi:hypothetical protein